MAKDVLGVNVVNMTKPQTGCLHDYPLTPDNLKTLEKAQVFVINGAGMEAFMDKVTKQIPNLKVVSGSDARYPAAGTAGCGGTECGKKCKAVSSHFYRYCLPFRDIRPNPILLLGNRHRVED